MEPPIQFARTPDGVDIAFWAIGEGPALVAMPSMPWSHLRLEWSIPEVERWYRMIGRGRRLVRYDGRGFGLSQREAPSFDLQAQVADLAAVIDRAGVDRVDLLAAQHSGPPAIAYAVQNPDRVAHLVLFCTYASGSAYASLPVIAATRGIIHQDWEFYTEAVARLLLGWTQPEAASRFARLIAACTTPELAGAVLAATGLGLVLWGRLTLGRLYGVSSTLGARLHADHRLITHGPFAHVRHPMYLGIETASFGGLLLYRTWTLVFLTVAFLGLMMRARREDELLRLEFGARWEAYRQQIPGWLPRRRRTKRRHPRD